MKNLFNSVSMRREKRNTFDLSHDVKLSLDMGELVPVMCTEVVPGDKFTIGGEALIRFAPMLAPVMHRYDSTIHYFFVPHRLIWDNWENWIRGEKNPTTGLPYPFPRIGVDHTMDGYTKLMDYFGIPRADQNPGATPGDVTQISALPFAAYQMIFNEYYRDQNLMDEVPYKCKDGYHSDNDLLNIMRWRSWKHDYFTSALPFAQAGDPVKIPVGDVTLKENWTQYGQPSFDLEDGGKGLSGGLMLDDDNYPYVRDENNEPVAYNPDGTLQVDAGTINDLRTANALQVWLERMARGGRRMKEFILTQFGVNNRDERLQRPEYIVGVKNNVVVSEVLNTTGTQDAPQGDMAGHGLGVMGGKFGSHYATEYGYIIGILNIQPITAYQQGIPKHFLKYVDNTQHYFPAFANLGEQPIELQELYAYTADAGSNFGYVPRYSEYKFENSRVAGDFRTNLNYWHHGIIYDSEPALNEEFITCKPDKRIFAVETTQNALWCHVYHKVKANRLMPKYGNPGLLI